MVHLGAMSVQFVRIFAAEVRVRAECSNLFTFRDRGRLDLRTLRAVSGLALALVAGLALLVAWRSRRAEPPERNELASA